MFEDAGDESRQVITDAWKEGVSQQLPSAFKCDTTESLTKANCKYNEKKKKKKKE